MSTKKMKKTYQYGAQINRNNNIAYLKLKIEVGADLHELEIENGGKRKEAILVTPGDDMVKYGEDAEILAHQEDFCNSEFIAEVIPPSKWSEVTREDKAILMINVKSNHSTKVRTHQLLGSKSRGRHAEA
ncbi:hypothetical protein T459_29776 [Capsicum annuum]|uniref:IP5PC-F immunoglobulin-like domain-containing protein n=1 Tax=Capsicum annuum TaxID=4072 RepID=A0A2G2Y706_CAPAN|nr:hypothetical protein T459_29776 [Capsicum annuum]